MEEKKNGWMDDKYDFYDAASFTSLMVRGHLDIGKSGIRNLESGFLFFFAGTCQRIWISGSTPHLYDSTFRSDVIVARRVNELACLENYIDGAPSSSELVQKPILPSPGHRFTATFRSWPGRYVVCLTSLIRKT